MSFFFLQKFVLPELPKDTIITPATEPLLDNNLQFLGEDGQKIVDSSIQFLTDDSHGVCLITPYSMDDTINSQYLTMN